MTPRLFDHYGKLIIEQIQNDYILSRGLDEEVLLSFSELVWLYYNIKDHLEDLDIAWLEKASFEAKGEEK